MPVSPAASDKKTAADYRQLPEGAPYELINGRLIAEPSPTYTHQEVSFQIAKLIGNHLDETLIGEILCAPLDVYFDEHNVYQPDILFIANDNKHIIGEDGKIHGAPDLIIEILSPSTGYIDMKEKKQVYEQFGVREYWLVDPKDNEVVGYFLEDAKYVENVRTYNRFYSPLLGTSISLSR